jgi:hypothetical protein
MQSSVIQLKIGDDDNQLTLGHANMPRLRFPPTLRYGGYANQPAMAMATRLRYASAGNHARPAIALATAGGGRSIRGAQ